jgi:chorismate mutase
MIPSKEMAEIRLVDMRRKIDELDRAIVRLLNQRAEKVAQIGFLKRSLDLPVRSRPREEMVLKNVAAANPGPLTEAALLSIYRRVLASMRGLQDGSRH